MWKENLYDFFHSAAAFLEMLLNCYNLRTWKDNFIKIKKLSIAKFSKLKNFTASKSRNNILTLLKPCEIK